MDKSIQSGSAVLDICETTGCGQKPYVLSWNDLRKGLTGRVTGNSGDDLGAVGSGRF